jgi:mitochondrial import inner membrane translocase subunit TIM22
MPCVNPVYLIQYPTGRLVSPSSTIRDPIPSFVGFFFGGFLGLFLASFSLSGPEQSLLTNQLAGGQVSTREQVRLALGDMGKRTWSSAKSFGKIAAIYSGTECVIEGVRTNLQILRPYDFAV